MEEIKYIGERLFAGLLGDIAIVTSFAASLLGMVAFFMAEKTKAASWFKLGKYAFIAHAILAFTAVGTLFWMLANNYFEFHYVWSHSNSEMPLRYVFSSFWEGQEGSFLLWIFWHAVLGLLLLFRQGKWTAPVIAIFSSVQAFLLSMVLGVVIGGYKLGSSPFRILLREHPDFANLPLFQNPDYVSLLDGSGLNPLLQNYWMTIHPPTLFLGFSLTLVPFAFALSGLWRKDFKGWFKPALPWAYTGVAILGLGILMGGAWAYEALSFGGFWAWDPVENASLVPWITLVAGAHLMMVFRSKGSSLLAAFFLILMSFLLVLYSTFLTRSGILGDTSVHAFTDLGMSGQLLVYLLFYTVVALALLAIRWKDFPKNTSEEQLWSREFWMFIGALVLGISAFQISFSTSIPVINKIFGSDLAPPSDVIDHYNKWQIPFAIVALMVIGFGQFLKYKSTPFKQFALRILPALVIALALTIVIMISLQMEHPHYGLMLFTGLFAITANFQYWVYILKGNLKGAGPAIAHIGFALVLVGALISTSQSEVISRNLSGVDVSQLGGSFTNQENILLAQNDTLEMGEYKVTYTGQYQEGNHILYNVHYENETESFDLQPRILLNERMGNSPEPDTKHYLSHDIYSHVTYAELRGNDKPSGDVETSTERTSSGDTLFTDQAIVVLDSMYNAKPDIEGIEESDIVVALPFHVIDFNTDVHKATSYFVLRDSSYTFTIPAEFKEVGLTIGFTKIFPSTGEVELSIEQTKSKRDFIILKAVVFPYINVLWLGIILMTLGSLLAVYQRVLKQRKK